MKGRGRIDERARKKAGRKRASGRGSRGSSGRREKEMRRVETSNENINKYKPLVKLYDRADIINDMA